MKEIKTLEDALALVPEYWYLTPVMDKWREGDEVLIEWPWIERRDKSGKWQKANNLAFGDIVDRLGRRPIPRSIRESEARWILYNSLATVGRSVKHEWRFLLQADNWTNGVHLQRYQHSMDNMADPAFSSYEEMEDAISALGGETAVIQMLTCGPGALWKWAQENRK